jgi:tyrosine-specific transport protein
MKKELILAIAVLMSTIIGAGIFGLPYAGAQSGFLIAAILLFVLTGIVTLLHLFYGKVIYHTEKSFQLTGYIGHYLGESAKKIIGIFVIIGFYGSLLVYMIIGGDFLHIALSPFINLSSTLFSLIMFVVGSIAIYFGLKLVSKWDLVINVILIMAIVILFIWGIGLIRLDNLKTIDLNKIITPYGAIFYSLIGIAALPQIKRIFSHNHEGQYRKAIIIGTIIPAIIYLIFMLIIVGINGGKTPQEAVSGLNNYLGRGAILIGSIFGFFMVMTSFFSLGIALKETYVYDYKMKKSVAWALTCFVPLILLLSGMRNFIIIIEVMGAMIGAVEGTAIILMYRRITNRKEHGILRVISSFVIALLFLGLVCTIINIFG